MKKLKYLIGVALVLFIDLIIYIVLANTHVSHIFEIMVIIFFVELFIFGLVILFEFINLENKIKDKEDNEKE